MPHHRDGVEIGDREVVCRQIGRAPRGRWSVVARCPFNRATVIETAPRLEDGTCFPTLYYLTCPWLTRFVSGLESAGAVREWALIFARDPDLAQAMREADSEYRSRRARAADGVDPRPGVGIAGQADPTATKCLHAHTAAALAGIEDPVGWAVLDSIDFEWCPDDLCVSGDEVAL